MAVNDGRDDSRRKFTVLANGYRVIGDGTLLPGARVTDFLNRGEPFLALTDAEVWQVDSGRRLIQAPFLDINRNCVEVLLSEEAPETGLG